MNTDIHRLLVATARNGSEEREICSLAGQITDWNLLIDLALNHGVLPLLHAKLTEVGASLPGPPQQRLAYERDRLVMHNLANASELISVLEVFQQEDIRAMPFKGVVLAASLYGDLLGRPGGDLDIVIDARDLKRASNLIRARGYQLTTTTDRDGIPTVEGCYEYHFDRPLDGRVLELRWRFDLVWNRFGRNLGIDWVWEDHRIIRFVGTEIPDIAPETLLLLLCMHGSKHRWSRLIWVCDIARLIASSPELNWDKTIHDATLLGLKRSLELGVLLAVGLLGATIPVDVLRRFEKDRVVRKLSLHFKENIVAQPGMPPPGPLPYGMKLLDRGDRLNVVVSRQFLQPSERDRSLIRLPKHLEWAYFLLRPLRLMVDRSPR